MFKSKNGILRDLNVHDNYVVFSVCFLMRRKMHCLQVNVMLKELPLEEFGPGINIREYSFLDNPSVPKEVNEYFYFNGQVTFLDLSLSGEHLLFAACYR